MKKSIAVILIFILISCSFCIACAEPRTARNSTLTFQGTTAECSCWVQDYGSSLSLIMKLYQDGRVVDTWYNSGSDMVSLNEIYNGRSGSTYKLTVTYSINGTRYNMPAITKVCP